MYGLQLHTCKHVSTDIEEISYYDACMFSNLSNSRTKEAGFLDQDGTGIGW